MGISIEAFDDAIDKTVNVLGSNKAKANLKLKAVKLSRYQDEGWQSFSLFFQGEDGFFLTQGTYLCSLPNLGEMELFISPRSPTEYESIFTHPKS